LGPLDFLSDASAPQSATPAISEPPASAITVETPAASTPEVPARGPDGKFVAKTAAGEAQAPALASPPASAPGASPAAELTPAAPDPIAALRAEMDEKYGKQIAGLTSALTQTRQQNRQQRQAPPPPDVWDENDHDYFRQEVGAARMETAQEYQTRLANQSFTFAEREFGKETTDAARAWASERCRRDPSFNQQLLESDHPAEIAVRAYQQDQILARLSDPAKAARLMALMEAEANPNPAPAPNPGQPAPQPVVPPRSLASAPSASGGVTHTPSGPGQSYDALF
jgi:hypothetical protein